MISLFCEKIHYSIYNYICLVYVGKIILDKSKTDIICYIYNRPIYIISMYMYILNTVMTVIFCIYIYNINFPLFN